MSIGALRESLKNLAPRSVRRAARASFKAIRDLRNDIQRQRGRELDQPAIVALLRTLGIKTGDTLIVHASLSRLGFIAGGGPMP